MQWEFNDNTPIYLQIMAQMKAEIAAGNLSPGNRLPSVRDMAVEAGVNPNTMQKALAELEREGLVYSQRTAGRFISENAGKSHELREAMVEQYMEAFTENMERMGYLPQETAKLYSEYVLKQK